MRAKSEAVAERVRVQAQQQEELADLRKQIKDATFAVWVCHAAPVLFFFLFVFEEGIGDEATHISRFFHPGGNQQVEEQTQKYEENLELLNGLVSDATGW